MPKQTSLQLIKTSDKNCLHGYEVYHQGQGYECLTSAFWQEIEQVNSFAFYGHQGNFTARKEIRQRGSAYWVAYRKDQQKLYKKYLGKTADLTIEKLEATAAALGAYSTVG